MLCEECKIEMRVERATNENPYRFEKCGLANVQLIGIDKFVCPRCKAVYPVVPKMQELHKVIALALINKPVELMGQEVRYLREWMGVSSQDFAEVLGFGPEHMSKVENNHAKLGAAGDRLVRLCAWAKIKSVAYDEVSERFRKLKRLKASRARVIHRRIELEADQTWKVQRTTTAA